MVSLSFSFHWVFLCVSCLHFVLNIFFEIFWLGKIMVNIYLNKFIDKWNETFCRVSLFFLLIFFLFFCRPKTTKITEVVDDDFDGWSNWTPFEPSVIVVPDSLLITLHCYRSESRDNALLLSPRASVGVFLAFISCRISTDIHVIQSTVKYTITD